MVTQEHIDGLKHLLIPVADDEWMMGHRGSEWLALAPDLEEDLALSSLSQDEMGHAQLFYDLAHGLGEREADYQVYHRPADRWHHAALTARPRDGWAEWVVRRYLYEIFDSVRRRAFSQIPYPPLLAALKKMDLEESYHLTHSRSLMRALAFGGSESRAYLDQALKTDWPLVPDFFEWSGPDDFWAGFAVHDLAPSVMRSNVQSVVQRDFSDWGIAWPGDFGPASRKARHHIGSDELAALLNEMREVRQVAPASNW
nr:1,2-phenylacetyl-CoA epoxidase subunit PaaC [Sulfobacillus harzensis]